MQQDASLHPRGACYWTHRFDSRLLSYFPSSIEPLSILFDPKLDFFPVRWETKDVWPEVLGNKNRGRKAKIFLTFFNFF